MSQIKYFLVASELDSDPAAEFSHQCAFLVPDQKQLDLQGIRSRAKRQTACAGCDNISIARANDLGDNEANGRATVEYGANAQNCRTARVTCGSDGLVHF
ncbi:unnamed protein product [Gongylonema pulchrum]|uniref:Ferredoxin n=1 Tax=Gongylonema pulchrum TaxID=637853 RepID=A0A183ER66_9BILA|nr:unnamed protein product [Gongylonema pulchrum]